MPIFHRIFEQYHQKYQVPRWTRHSVWQVVSLRQRGHHSSLMSREYKQKAIIRSTLPYTKHIIFTFDYGTTLIQKSDLAIYLLYMRKMPPELTLSKRATPEAISRQSPKRRKLGSREKYTPSAWYSLFSYFHFQSYESSGQLD